MALGYRHWSGIGVAEDCMSALSWYESAAEQATSGDQCHPAEDIDPSGDPGSDPLMHRKKNTARTLTHHARMGMCLRQLMMATQ